MFAGTNCGDGHVERPEECDDRIDGVPNWWPLNVDPLLDGCEACVVDVGFVCEKGDLSRPSVCAEICGDGKNYGVNPCDDNNTSPFDGCDENC